MHSVGSSHGDHHFTKSSSRLCLGRAQLMEKAQDKRKEESGLVFCFVFASAFECVCGVCISLFWLGGVESVLL